MARFMVVADGAGEYNHDFSVVWIEAEDAEDAAKQAVAPMMGYGHTVMYVVPVDQVAQFDVYDHSERKVAGVPLSPPGEDD